MSGVDGHPQFLVVDDIPQKMVATLDTGRRYFGAEYSFTNQLLHLLSYVFTFRDGSSVLANLKPAFSQPSEGHWRVPDYVPLIFSSKNMTKVAQSAWMIKSLPPLVPGPGESERTTGWYSETARQIVSGSLQENIRRFFDMALCAFFAYGEKIDKFFLWFQIGPYFSALEYLRDQFPSTTTSTSELSSSSLQDPTSDTAMPSRTIATPRVLCHAEELIDESGQITDTFKVALSRWLLPSNLDMDIQSSPFSPPDDGDQYQFNASNIEKAGSHISKALEAERSRLQFERDVQGGHLRQRRPKRPRNST